MNKKIIAVVAAVVVVVAGIILALSLSDKEVKTEENTVKVENQNKEEGKDIQSSPENTPEAEQKVYTPTFMYFVSDEDANKEETDKMIEELKKEYEGKVNFDIRNITKTPEDGENFPVKGATPALIMLNTTNDICAMEFMCADKEKLVGAIENALK